MAACADSKPRRGFRRVERLHKGLDDIGLVMQNIKEIEAFEKRYHEEMLSYWMALIRLEEMSGLDLVK